MCDNAYLESSNMSSICEFRIGVSCLVVLLFLSVQFFSNWEGSRASRDGGFFLSSREVPRVVQGGSSCRPGGFLVSSRGVARVVQ